MTRLLRDTGLLFRRNMNVTLRNPVWVIMGLFQPILYLVLFAPLLDSLRMPGFGQTNSLNLFTPGMLIMMALFGVGFVGFSVIEDLRAGVVERLRVTPASRLALLMGMVLRDIVVLLVQCTLLIAVSTLMGMRPDPLGIVFIYGLMILIGMMMASVSYAIGLMVKDEGGLAATLNSILLPLQLLSGVLLPLTLAPKLLQNIAKFNPFAHAVDASRALVDGHYSDNAVPLAFVVISVFAVAAAVWATRIFRKATA